MKLLVICLPLFRLSYRKVETYANYHNGAVGIVNIRTLEGAGEVCGGDCESVDMWQGVHCTEVLCANCIV